MVLSWHLIKNDVLSHRQISIVLLIFQIYSRRKKQYRSFLALLDCVNKDHEIEIRPSVVLSSDVVSIIAELVL